MTIAAYCRVSTDQEAQLDSLQHQKDFFTAYAERNGHRLYRLYADEGISGTSLKKREAFKRLMEDAEQGRFQTVVVKDISRFARNTVDALQSIRRLKAMGINTQFLTANMDTMGDSEFIITLFSAMAQEESSNLSKRVKWGKRINAEKGRVPQRIFGYDRLDNFTLTVNPTEGAVVRKIFSLYIHQGLGCRTISTVLNREQDKTKEGCSWDPRAVRRILTNPLYCGTLVNHKYEIEDFLSGKQVSIPREQQFYHDRPDWAIISRQEFQTAQEIMETRRVKYEPGQLLSQGRHSSRHLFSTLLKCVHCGRSFCRKSYTYAKTRTYWKCVTNDQYTAQRCDNLTKLEEGELAEQLHRYILNRIGDRQAFADRILAEMSQLYPKEEDPVVRQREQKRRQDRLLIRRNRIVDMYEQELLTMPELKEKLSRIDGELAELEQERKCLAGEQGAAAREQEYRAQIESFLDFRTVTNTDLRKMVEHITVDKTGEVRVFLKGYTQH